jgi:hypothetical protein
MISHSGEAAGKLILAAALLVSSCDSRPSGRWMLVRVDSGAVPTAIAHFPGDTLKIFGGSIEFRGGDTVLRSERTEGWRQVDTGTVRLWHYQMRHDSILMDYDCASNMRCPGTESGILTQDSLVLRSSRLGGVLLIYNRAVPR